MKYLLISTLLSWGLTFFAYYYARSQGDNFGVVFIPMGALLASAILTGTYLACALWTHRLW